MWGFGQQAYSLGTTCALRNGSKYVLFLLMGGKSVLPKELIQGSKLKCLQGQGAAEELVGRVDWLAPSCQSRSAVPTAAQQERGPGLPEPLNFPAK